MIAIPIRLQRAGLTFREASAANGLVMPAATFVAATALAAVAGDAIAPHDPFTVNLVLRNQPPLTPADGGLPYLLGTDALGRDVLSRLIVGARIALAVGLASVALSGVIGTFLGLTSGYAGGRGGRLIMRLADLQMAFPSLLLALFVLYVIGGGFLSVVIVLAALRWPVYARVSRSLTLGAREESYVDFARTLGASPRRVLFRHIFPNVLSPLIVLATLEIATLVLAEAALDFLGLGIRPPQTSWGLMVAEGREYISSAWWLVVFPGLAIFLLALSVNVIARGLRQVSDDAR